MSSKRRKTKKRTPRAFISYSWDDENHKEWVRGLAGQLMTDGVDVTLDQWDAAPGDQLPQFMENSVRDGDFVLIICTPGYKRKWEACKGGVLFEGRIMTAEVLTTQNNRKFIPILRTALWPDAAPAWLLGSYYVDLSDPDSFEINYKDLLQTLHGQRPPRPRLGRPPKPSKSGSRLQPDQLATSKLRRVLPTPRNRLIGRDQDVAHVCDMLGGKYTGLVTLTGPGGTGKTRLALKIAKTIKRKFADGVFYIELSPIKDPSLVASAIAQALEIKENPGEPLLQTIITQLHEKQLLLVIDNFEHVISAAPHVGSLISLCPRLKVLITSRRPLKINYENEFSVTPLTFPEDQDFAVTGISQYSAIQLFIERVKAVDPTFEATADNLPTLATICARLDGLPLALELAAARIRLFKTPRVLLEELLDPSGRLRFSVLTDGNRNLDARQQTLEATIAWSYDLLEDNEKALLRQLTVFAGGFTLAAAGNVCRRLDVLQQIAALVDWKLLVQQEGFNGGPRFVMLETIREYAVRCLAEISSEKQDTESQHAHYFLREVEVFEKRLADPEIKSSMDWFKAEQDNLRSALSWSLENDVVMALRFAYFLSGFWNILGQLNEERSALNLALEKEEQSPLDHESQMGTDTATELLMRVLGRAAGRQLNPAEAEVLAERHLTLSRETGRKSEQAFALHNLGNIARLQGKLEQGRERLKEAVTLFRQQGDKEGMAIALLSLCVLATDQDDFQFAKECAIESLALSIEVKNRGHIPLANTYLAFVLHKAGERETPDALTNESIEMLRKDGRQSWLPWALHWKGRIALGQGDLEIARINLLESLSIFQKNEDKGGQLRCLLAFAWFYAAQGDYKRSITLLGAEEAQRKRDAAPPPPDWKREIEFIRTAATRSLGDSQFGSIYTGGQRLSLIQAVELAQNGLSYTSP